MSETEPVQQLVPTPVHWDLERRRLTLEGMHDAFIFALEHSVQEIEVEASRTWNSINDSRLLEGPMKPGAGPRIYKDGYLAGLREALEIIARHTHTATEYEPSPASQEQERTLAEDATTAYRADGEDDSARQARS
jgi:hypothetical protein